MPIKTWITCLIFWFMGCATLPQISEPILLPSNSAVFSDFDGTMRLEVTPIPNIKSDAYLTVEATVHCNCVTLLFTRDECADRFVAKDPHAVYKVSKEGRGEITINLKEMIRDYEINYLYQKEQGGNYMLSRAWFIDHSDSWQITGHGTPPDH